MTKASEALNLDNIIIQWRNSPQEHEHDLAERISLYAHSAIWQHKAKFTAEEREDISSDMIIAGLEQATTKDFTGITSPGGWIIRCMHNVLHKYMDKATYRTRMLRALCESMEHNPLIPLRRQCLNKDRWAKQQHRPAFKCLGTL